jgi:di/tricarboxylate transporter
MSPALLALLALLVAISLSIATRVNVGLASIALAWVVGVYAGGMSADAVLKGFPASLFLTLAGVTLLFAAAESNGTLERIAERLAALARGSARILPLVLFLLSSALASVGPGAIAAVALLAPMAMVLGKRTGVSPLLTALMVTMGANSGNLSPLSPTGVIANARMAAGGIGGHDLKVWLANLLAHVIVAAAMWVVLARRPSATGDGRTAFPAVPVPFDPRQRITSLVILLWVIGVLGFKLNLGLSAFAAAILLIALRAADERQAIARIPWTIVLMVCGVSVLVAVLEATGGMDLFTALLANLASPATINGVIAFITGAISTWSSTSGVVLPAFLPTVPKLVAQVGGGDPLAVALSINVGSSLVDVSPLSTLGALCVAAAAPEDAGKLFRQLLGFGLSMIVVGALLCQLLAAWFARV